MPIEFKNLKTINKSTKRYLIIGISVYLVEVLVIVFAQKIGFSSVISVAASFWIGLVLSFILQKVITFQDKRVHHKVITTQLLLYSLLVLFNFGFTILVTKLFAHSINLVILRSVALAITTIWNYYIYKTRIFKIGNMPQID